MPQPETIESLRPLLLSIAYRMLGAVSDAEDVVQEALLRYHRAVQDGTRVLSLKAYLSAVVTRLSIDQLRSARERREQYVGAWIPEPLLTDHAAADPLAVAEADESVSMAFLLLLERLSPVERAVFLLHDVFGYPFSEVAEIVGRSEANTRQLALRARRHVDAGRPRFEVSPEARDALADRFFAAVTAGDMDELIVSVFVLDIGDGAVRTIRSVINPDKLQHLGPVADVYGLLRSRHAPRPQP